MVTFAGDDSRQQPEEQAEAEEYQNDEGSRTGGGSVTSGCEYCINHIVVLLRSVCSLPPRGSAYSGRTLRGR